MLISPRPEPPPLKGTRSLRREYEEFILQRVEDYKNQISRADLIRLADDAVRELVDESGAQLTFTEVLLTDRVDQLIVHRLNLPPYTRWRERFVRLRMAQREPTHWGLGSDGPVINLVRRLESGDQVAVAGRGVLSIALFAAAHEGRVVFMDNDLASVDAAENRAAVESLGRDFEAFVVDFEGQWLPDFRPALVVLDPDLVASLGHEARVRLLGGLRDTTVTGGVHCVPGHGRTDQVMDLSRELLAQEYADWAVDRRALADGCLVATRIQPHP